MNALETSPPATETSLAQTNASAAATTAPLEVIRHEVIRLVRKLETEERTLLKFWLSEESRRAIIYAHIEDFLLRRKRVPSAQELHIELQGIVPARTLSRHLKDWQTLKSEPTSKSEPKNTPK